MKNNKEYQAVVRPDKMSDEATVLFNEADVIEQELRERHTAVRSRESFDIDHLIALTTDVVKRVAITFDDAMLEHRIDRLVELEHDLEAIRASAVRTMRKEHDASFAEDLHDWMTYTIDALRARVINTTIVIKDKDDKTFMRRRIFFVSHDLTTNFAKYVMIANYSMQKDAAKHAHNIKQEMYDAVATRHAASSIVELYDFESVWEYVERMKRNLQIEITNRNEHARKHARQ